MEGWTTKYEIFAARNCGADELRRYLLKMCEGVRVNMKNDISRFIFPQGG